MKPAIAAYLRDLKERRAEIDTTIRVIERDVNVTNGHRPISMSTVAEALAMTRGKKKLGRPKKKPAANGEVAVPATTGELSLADATIPEAVMLALRAVENPVEMPELVALLESAGAKTTSKHYDLAGHVKIAVAQMKRAKKVKHTRRGWSLYAGAGGGA